MRRISSRQNALVAEFRDAARSATPGVMLLDGAHLVAEAVGSGIRIRHVIVASDAVHRPDIAPVLARLEHGPAELATATASVMAAVSPVRSSSPIVALAERPAVPGSIFDPELWHDAASTPTEAPPALVVIVCDVQDPGNAGAIVRVAEAAGATGAVFAGQSADPFGWKALRGSMGSALRLPIVRIERIEDAVDDARQHGVTIVATIPHEGASLFDARLDTPTALLIGGEGLGLPDNLVAASDARLTIPMQAPVQSLNAAVAAAILLYEAHRQRTAVRTHAAGSDVLTKAR